MSAPSDTTWGNVIASGTNEGRIGISRTWADYGTYEHADVTVWFWTKYRVSDTNNSYYYSRDTEPSYQGARNIQTPTNSAWSTSNQVVLGTYSYNLPKGQSDYTTYFNASITGIDILGSGNVSYASRPYTVYRLDSYTVSYNANGGSGAPNSQTKWHGSTLTLSNTRPTRTGHDFVGWGTSSTDTTVDYNAGGQYVANANITLYAIWKPHTYVVSYDANGGSGAPNNQTKTYGVNLTLSGTEPTRKDYNFLGWNTYKTATEPLYEAGDVYKNNSAVTLYAVWEVAYIKPRINKFSAYRCDAEGNAQEDGTNVKISFEWATDLTGVSFRPYYKKKDDGDDKYVSADAVALDGTSGKQEYIIKKSSSAVTFSTEESFNIKMNITDSNGFSTVYALVNSIFIPIDMTPNGENMSFGEPAKETTVEKGMYRVAYTNIDLAPKNRLLYKGEVMFGQKQIWPTTNQTGSSIMNETHSITLSKKISEMKNGILLVFGRDGSYSLSAHFVPKQSVVSFGRAGWTFMLCTDLFDYIGAKTLYISDEKIEGHANNDATAKNGVSGITYHNEAFYLKYVYEV